MASTLANDKDNAAPSHRFIEERRHFIEILHSFRDYSAWMGLEARRREQHAARLPARYRALLPTGSLEARQHSLRQAVELNQALLDAMCDAQVESGFGSSFGGVILAPPKGDSAARLAAPPSSSEAHFSKVRSTLHQLVRDWSAEGSAEREQSYGALLRALDAALPVSSATRNKQRVLIPGCGLGRLVFDLAAAGYAAQGNEFSLQMLFVSHFVLNCLPHLEDVDGTSDGEVAAAGERAGGLSFCPWIHDPNNHLRVQDMMRVVSIPDVLPSTLLAANPGADMSMTAGEFCEIYSAAAHAGAWDAVVTCFFVDTAPVPMEYIDVIAHCLRDGGVWVNCGPLQYHWAAGDPTPAARDRSSSSGHEHAPASSGSAGVASSCAVQLDEGVHCADGDERYGRSLELSYQELRHAIIASGFTMRAESTRQTTYAANKLGLSRTLFTTLNFTAVRGRREQDAGALGL